MVGQILKIFKLLGVRRAVRMKKRHEVGLGYVRGYAASCCWWALLNAGLLDELADNGGANVAEYAKDNRLDGDVLEAIVEYLDGIGLLERRGEIVELSKRGRDILAEPRGLFELLWAYEPCFGAMGQLLSGEKRYGRDLSRRVTFVGIGSGRLCEQLPYPVMRRMVLANGGKTVLDLGCGDLAFLEGLCRLEVDSVGNKLPTLQSGIRCHGIDCSEEMIRFDEQKLAASGLGDRISVQVADMFDIGELPSDLPPIDCITACDTFHEYLDEPERLVALLKELRERFGATFVIGEFCLQDAGWLRRHKTASLEHHLFHRLSNQQIGSAQQWRDIFGQAGLSIVEEEVYDMIGHGYFMVR